MKDPRMDGAMIMRRTCCKMGTHAFQWASIYQYGRPTDPHDTTLRCTCGAYTWAEWTNILPKGG